MKTLSEMSFNEKLDWASGELIVSIGRGDFRSALSMILLGVSQEAYDRGKGPKTASNLGELKNLVDYLLLTFPANTPILKNSLPGYSDFEKDVDFRTVWAKSHTEDSYYYTEMVEGQGTKCLVI